MIPSKQIFSGSLMALACVGLLGGSLVMSGCAKPADTGASAEKKDNTLQLEVAEIDQVSKLGDKTPDGQFMIAKVMMKNNSNATIVLNPQDFMLENITTEEKDRYSQPSEKFITVPFGQAFGDAAKDKVMDLSQANLYPRLQLERYFVFMVPADAKAEQYQITYTPSKISAPLVTSSTVINDHRNDAATSPTQP